jgi:hypothetical protein
MTNVKHQQGRTNQKNPFYNNSIKIYHHSIMPLFQYSLLHYSNIPPFHSSINPLLPNSKTLELGAMP